MIEHVGHRVLIRNSSYPKTSTILEVKILEVAVKGVYVKVTNLMSNNTYWIVADDYEIVDNLRDIENDRQYYI